MVGIPEKCCQMDISLSSIELMAKKVVQVCLFRYPISGLHSHIDEVC